MRERPKAAQNHQGQLSNSPVIEAPADCVQIKLSSTKPQNEDLAAEVNELKNVPE